MSGRGMPHVQDSQSAMPDSCQREDFSSRKVLCCECKCHLHLLQDLCGVLSLNTNDDLSQPFLRTESHHSKISKINYTLPQNGAKYSMCKPLSLCRKQNSVMLGRSKRRNNLISDETGKENS